MRLRPRLSPKGISHALPVFSAMQRLLAAPTAGHADDLYLLLRRQQAETYLGELLTVLANEPVSIRERLITLGRWLVTRAADREPIKVGLGLLALGLTAEDHQLLMTLGRHEEFTHVVMVVLRMAEANPERALWELAKSVLLWGRVELIEQLAGTQDAEIKSWLLCEGYHCEAHLDIYVALPCAIGGDLCNALREPCPDPKLLKGADRLLCLLLGLSAGDGIPRIKDYPQGAEAILYLLRHGSTMKITSSELLTLDYLRRFLSRRTEIVADPAMGWQRYLAEITSLIDSIYASADTADISEKGHDERRPARRRK